MFTALLFATALAASAPDADLARTLEAADQALMNAFAPGDRSVWDAALAPDAVYLDENNVLFSRAEFLEQLTPLPPHTSGQIKAINIHFTRSGDVAIIVHEDEEAEDWHGQILHATYLTSETWQRTGGGWKILMVHESVKNLDPPSVKLSADDLAAYAGVYRVGDLTSVIALKQGRLILSRAGRPDAELLAELKDMFFVPGQPRMRKVFERRPDGSVTGFIDRREGEDIVWQRQ